MKTFLTLSPLVLFLAACSASPFSLKLAPTLDPPDHRISGNPEATVVLEEWSDFRCPFCGRAQETVNKLEEKYGDRIQIVFRHLPLESLHPGVTDLHVAVECEKDNFYEAKMRAFTGEELGIPETCDEDAARRAVDADMEEAAARGITSTPTFFLNGERILGARDFSVFDGKIGKLLGE